MKPPRISVLMPAYNSEEYIGQAIESILNQTFSDFEFIIINDGSNDKTADVVRSYNDKRIRFVDNPKNKGLVAVLNQGLDLCRGEYVARMDSDDISLPKRFEKQVAYMDKHPECSVLGTWFECFGKSDGVVQHPEHIKIMDILNDHHVGHPTVFIRKSVIDKYDFRYDKNYTHAEDFELWSRMVFVTEIHNLPEILLNYRWTDTNVSTVHAEEQRNVARRVKQNVVDKLTDDTVKQRILLHEMKQGFLLPKWLGRICCLVIPSHSMRHNFRSKYVKD